jgi:hypothetical protein
MVLQPDGRTVMAGVVEGGNSTDIVVARFLGDPTAEDGGVDVVAPRQTLGRKRIQDVDRLVVKVTSDEAATLGGQAIVKVPGRRRPLRSRNVTAAVAAGATVALRLRFARRKLAAIKDAIADGRMRKARISVTATDASGNASAATTSVRLKD